MVQPGQATAAGWGTCAPGVALLSHRSGASILLISPPILIVAGIYRIMDA